MCWRQKLPLQCPLPFLLPRVPDFRSGCDGGRDIARKAFDMKWPVSCSTEELSVGSASVAAFPCGWGIWLSAASKSPTWNALCISLEGSQTVL